MKKQIETLERHQKNELAGEYLEGRMRKCNGVNPSSVIKTENGEQHVVLFSRECCNNEELLVKLVKLVHELN